MPVLRVELKRRISASPQWTLGRIGTLKHVLSMIGECKVSRYWKVREVWRLAICHSVELTATSDIVAREASFVQRQR